MPSPRRPLALLLLTLVAAASGCGGGDPTSGDSRGDSGDNILAESDVAMVLEARRTIDAACGSDGSTTTARLSPQLDDAVGRLAGITQEYPGRVYETGNEDRAEKMSVISDEVSDQLRRCGITDQADRLAKAVS